MSSNYKYLTNTYLTNKRYTFRVPCGVTGYNRMTKEEHSFTGVADITMRHEGDSFVIDDFNFIPVEGE